MAAHTIRPALRLVGADVAPPQHVLRPGHALDGDETHRRGVAAENRAAAKLSALDVRWVFAVQVARQLEGGQAAILPPERRAQLMATARRIGLRDFDASLIVAIVQDTTRRGEDALGPATSGRLELVRTGEPIGHTAPPALWQTILVAGVAGFVLALAMLYALIRWLTA